MVGPRRFSSGRPKAAAAPTWPLLASPQPIMDLYVLNDQNPRPRPVWTWGPDSQPATFISTKQGKQLQIF